MELLDQENKNLLFIQLYKIRRKACLFSFSSMYPIFRKIVYHAPQRAFHIHAPRIDYVPCICISVYSIRTSVSLPFRKQILIPRSLGPPGHHSRHSSVLPLFFVSRITPCCISRNFGNVIYTRRSL